MNKEGQFKATAKQLIDAMFDAGSFREDITRDQMNDLEGFISGYMDVAWDLAKRCDALLERMNPIPDESDNSEA